MLSGDLRESLDSWLPVRGAHPAPSTRDYHSLVVLHPSSEQSGLYWVAAWSPSETFCSSPWGPAPAEATPESAPEGTASCSIA